MAHEIFGNRFMSRNVPAWHALGTVFTTRKSAKEALQEIDQQYGKIIIDKLPYGVQVPEYGMFTPEDEFMLVRRPTIDSPKPRAFGKVSGSYTVLQNEQLAEIFDTLLDNTGMSVETIGILHDGMTIFFTTLFDKEYTVGGDQVKMYFMLTDNRNGKEGLTLQATPVRVVCNNTLTLALSSKDNSLTLSHHSDLYLETAWRMEMITKAVKQGEGIVNALQTLTEIEVKHEKLDELLEAIFPLPKASRTLDLLGANNAVLQERGSQAQYHHEWRKQATLVTREEVKENMLYLANGNPINGWHAFNAVTGWIDHQSGKQTENGKRVMAQRSIEQTELRTKAYNAIKSL